MSFSKLGLKPKVYTTNAYGQKSILSTLILILLK